MILELITWARAHGRLEELVEKASQEIPGNPALKHFAQEFLHPPIKQITSIRLERIAGIHLSYIACFEDLALSFVDEKAEEPAPWILILGENGTGKSTLLQMIGATLLDRQQFAVVAGNIDLKSYVHTRSNAILEGTCSLSLWSEAKDTKEAVYEASLSLTALTQYDPIAVSPFGNSLTAGGFVCGYGTTRRISGQPVNDRGPIPTLDDSAKPYRFASLFGDASGMTNVSGWIAKLYFQTLYPGHTEADEKRFENARSAILRALPYISALDVTQDSQVMVSDGKTTVPLERLSDGYRGTLAWVGDLIRRLFDAYPESPDPLKEHGIVLVDEIDLHLHPRWQRSVVEDIRALFPNLQFIVTSHSPFVAQDMRPQDRIVVLERSGKDRRGPVVAREEPGVLQDWSADQILSAYFNLPRGTRSAALQNAEARYEFLLDAQATRKLNRSERAELEKLGAQLDRVPIGVTPDEQAFDRAAENVLASLRQRYEALEKDSRNTPRPKKPSNKRNIE